MGTHDTQLNQSTELLGKVSEAWAGLAEDQKKAYQNIADTNMAKYNRAVIDYKGSINGHAPAVSVLHTIRCLIHIVSRRLLPLLRTPHPRQMKRRRKRRKRKRILLRRKQRQRCGLTYNRMLNGTHLCRLPLLLLNRLMRTRMPLRQTQTLPLLPLPRLLLKRLKLPQHPNLLAPGKKRKRRRSDHSA
jgi:hypothetical protein